jgi:hypothetical protein
MGGALKRVALFFALFLSVLGMLATARYPVLPESLVAIYRVDRDAGATLSAALTLIGLAGSLFLIVPKLLVNRVKRCSSGSARAPIWAGMMSLSTCVLALVGNAVFIRASTRMANAIEAAKERDSFDLLARDTLTKMNDESSSIRQRYRAAMEFLDAERPEEIGSEDILNLAERAPLQDLVFITYVMAICCLKTAFFLTSSAIYVLGNRANR